MYLYVDVAEVKQVCYEVFVSKEKGERRECASPATIPHGDVIQRNVRYLVLRGSERCIEGCDCGRKVQASTVFCLDHWTRRKGKCKGNDLKERKEKIRRRDFNDNKGKRGDKAKRVQGGSVLGHVGSTNKAVCTMLFGGEWAIRESLT